MTDSGGKDERQKGEGVALNHEEWTLILLQTLLEYKQTEIHWIHRAIVVISQQYKAAQDTLTNAQQNLTRLKAKRGSKKVLERLQMRKLEDVVSRTAHVPAQLKTLLEKGTRMKKEAELLLEYFHGQLVTNDTRLSEIQKTLEEMVDKKSGNFERLKQAMILETDKILTECQEDLAGLRDNVLPYLSAQKEQKENLEHDLRLESLESSKTALAVNEFIMLMIQKSQTLILAALHLYVRHQAGEDVVADSEAVMNSGFQESNFNVVSEIFQKYNLDVMKIEDVVRVEPKVLKKCEDVKKGAEEMKKLKTKFYTMVAAIKLYQQIYLSLKNFVNSENRKGLSDARNVLILISEKRESAKKSILEGAKSEWLNEQEQWLKKLIRDLETVSGEVSKVADEGKKKNSEKFKKNHDEQDLRKIKDTLLLLLSGSEDVENLKQTITSETDRIITELEPLSSKNTNVRKRVYTLKGEQIGLLKFYDVMTESFHSLTVLEQIRKELKKIEDDSVDEEATREVDAFMARKFGHPEGVEGVLTTLLHRNLDFEKWPALSAVIHHDGCERSWHKIPAWIQILKNRVENLRAGQEVPFFDDEISERESEVLWMTRILEGNGAEGYQFVRNPYLLNIAYCGYDCTVVRLKRELAKFQKYFVPFWKKFKTTIDTSSDDSDAKDRLLDILKMLGPFETISETVEKFLKTWKEMREEFRKENIIKVFDGSASDDVKEAEFQKTLKSMRLKSEVITPDRLKVLELVDNPNLRDSEIPETDISEFLKPLLTNP